MLGFCARCADVAVPPLTGRVVDLTGTLGSGDIAALTQTLKNLELRKGSQVAVLIVPTTQPESIEQYSIRVAEAWKIGRKKIDDGALLVIAKNDHKLRIEVGYGLEGSLTDVTSRRIIDEVITPKFRSGDFAGGISDGVARIIAVIDGETLPAPAPEASHGQDFSDWIGFFNPINPFFIVGVAAVGAILRKIAGQADRLGRNRRRDRLARLVSLGLDGDCGHPGGDHLRRRLFRRQHFCREHERIAPAWQARRLVGRLLFGRRWRLEQGGSSSSDSDSGFSGGGGSFGGGGASGSW